jgi:hypothetical protein
MKRNSLLLMARTSSWRMVSMVMGGTSDNGNLENHIPMLIQRMRGRKTVIAH